MKHLERTGVGGAKGAGRIRQFLEECWFIGPEKASNLLGNGLSLQGSVGAGSVPLISAVGDDANVDIGLAPKGAGMIEHQGPDVSAETAANCVSGGAKTCVEIMKSATNLVDNTVSDFDVPCTVTIPNANEAASLEIFLHASLGDQDSSEVSYWTLTVSRIAGANAKAVLSAKSNNVNTTGVSGNAAATVSLQAIQGAVGAVNTFKIQLKVARSAGASTNHDAVAYIDLVNVKGAGITIS